MFQNAEIAMSHTIRLTEPSAPSPKPISREEEKMALSTHRGMVLLVYPLSSMASTVQAYAPLCLCLNELAGISWCK